MTPVGGNCGGDRLLGIGWSKWRRVAAVMPVVENCGGDRLLGIGWSKWRRVTVVVVTLVARDRLLVGTSGWSKWRWIAVLMLVAIAAAFDGTSYLAGPSCCGGYTVNNCSGDRLLGTGWFKRRRVAAQW